MAAKGEREQPDRIKGRKQAGRQDRRGKQAALDRFPSPAPVRPPADERLDNQHGQPPARKKQPDVLARPTQPGELEREQYLNGSQRGTGDENHQAGAHELTPQSVPEKGWRDRVGNHMRGGWRLARQQGKDADGQAERHPGKIQEGVTYLTQTAEGRSGNHANAEGHHQDAHFHPTPLRGRQPGREGEGRSPGRGRGDPLRDAAAEQGPEPAGLPESERGKSQGQHTHRQPPPFAPAIHQQTKGEVEQQRNQPV